MTRAEFAIVIAFLAKGVGLKQPDAGQVEVYFDLLCDLPLAVVQEAARRSLMEHKYPNLPPVGLIRWHAVALSGNRTPGPEAWAMALNAARRYGRANESRALATMPADVAHAVRCFGLGIICDATYDELGIVQTQFLKVYDTLSKRDERRELMPPMTPACAALVGGTASRLVAELDEKPTPRLAAGTTK